MFLFQMEPEDAVLYLRETFHINTVYVTCGSKGCWFGNSVGVGHVDSLQVKKVVDTTGAGDIFGGSALWKILQLDNITHASIEELRKAVQFATIAAGLSVQKAGGISSIPMAEEIVCKL